MAKRTENYSFTGMGVEYQIKFTGMNQSLGQFRLINSYDDPLLPAEVVGPTIVTDQSETRPFG